VLYDPPEERAGKRVFLIDRPGAEQSTIFLGLPFDRRQESDADIVGLDYMSRAGFDPRESLKLWRNMSALNQGSPPEWLSTHPSDDTRMADLVRSITPALIAYNEFLDTKGRPRCM